jgi:hypothetical protein
MRAFISKTSIFVIAVTAALSCIASVRAQDGGKIVSGTYDSLLIAVDAKGGLTGYFDEGTGDNGRGRPQFTCTFFISGDKQPDGSYRISTWHPGVKEDEVVQGVLKFSGKSGKTSVNMRLDAEHGGCWNVAPALKEKVGIDFDLDSSAKWEGIRMIAPNRAWLFISPEAGAPQKIYVVKNDAVRILSETGEWAEISFVNAARQTTRGWLKNESFYPIKPSAK